MDLDECSTRAQSPEPGPAETVNGEWRSREEGGKNKRRIRTQGCDVSLPSFTGRLNSPVIFHNPKYWSPNKALFLTRRVEWKGT